MAYDAVISLKQTIEWLLNSDRIEILSPSREIIESAHEEVQSLQKVLEEFDSSSSSSSERIPPLVERIREAVSELESVVESNVFDQFHSQSEEKSLREENHPFSFSLDLQELKQDIGSLIQNVNKFKEEYIEELSNPLPEEVKDDDDDPSRIDFQGNNSKMVGLYDEYSQIKDLLTHDESGAGCIAASLVGMAGIGKTTLAKEIFEDPSIMGCFDCRVWVTVGPKYQFTETRQLILAQVDPDNTDTRYLIVFDDVWSTNLWDDFKRLLPYHKSRTNVVLLTTRLQEVAAGARSFYSDKGIVNMPLLNKQESWDLLRKKAFAEESCSFQLERAGKKIAEKCEGLPLLIVTIARILSESEKTAEYWNKVAEEEENLDFYDAYEEISNVLLPSYLYLPLSLKACFLYMGVFPRKYEIPRSKLVNLWSAEGFRDTKCLNDLVSRSIVMVRENSSSQSFINLVIKTCSLHSTFWHLCVRQAEKSKCFHVLNKVVDASAQGVKSQRRLCIRNNVLFGIKDVNSSISSIPKVHSVLCTGPYHQYPVPIYLDLRLLRVLDALTLRFYEFPEKVLELLQLRYLAITCDGKLPPTISRLWNLQYLIVCRYLSINLGDDSFCNLPVEIWDMKELIHLQIVGGNLPDPNGALLQNLLTLLDVNARSCTQEILKAIPNLKKLRIQIELVPGSAENENSNCFDHIASLGQLKTLKCVVVNPDLVVTEIAPLSIFPPSLKKLTLSGLGYPWEEMSKIASLPNLQVLKLQCYAFRGRKWETRGGGFPRLEFLLIEDADLERWRVEDEGFQFLNCLIIKHCYKLEEIPTATETIFQLFRKIELIDCNPLAVKCAERIKEDWYKEYGISVELKIMRPLIVNIHSSYDDKSKHLSLRKNPFDLLRFFRKCAQCCWPWIVS